MHSLSKMRRIYPQLSETSGPMRFLYRQVWNSKNDGNSELRSKPSKSTTGAKYKDSDLFDDVKNISYDDFLNKTSLEFEIIGN